MIQIVGLAEKKFKIMLIYLSKDLQGKGRYNRQIDRTFNRENDLISNLCVIVVSKEEAKDIRAKEKENTEKCFQI